jgi:hypothetical protein
MVFEMISRRSGGSRETREDLQADPRMITAPICTSLRRSEARDGGPLGLRTWISISGADEAYSSAWPENFSVSPKHIETNRSLSYYYRLEPLRSKTISYALMRA